MKLIYGLAALCTVIACCFAIWWAYITGSANDQHKIVAFILAASVFVGAILYLIIFAHLAKRAATGSRAGEHPLGTPPKERPAANGFRDPKWQIISSRKFENESILIDGKSFRNCTFTNVTFLFHGTAPTEFTGQSQFAGSIRLSTNHPPTMFWRTLEHMFSTIPGAEVETSPVDRKGNKLEPRVTGFPVAADDEAQLSLEPADGEIHSYDPAGKSYFFVRSCCPRFLRNIRFDPIESRGGHKIWLDGIASLSPGERVPVGFHAGEDGKYRGVVNHIINFFEGGSSAIDQPTYQITARFLDGAKERTERHTIESHPLPKGGVSLRIVPNV
jgi:hypothetical protein